MKVFSYQGLLIKLGNSDSCTTLVRIQLKITHPHLTLANARYWRGWPSTRMDTSWIYAPRGHYLLQIIDHSKRMNVLFELSRERTNVLYWLWTVPKIKNIPKATLGGQEKMEVGDHSSVQRSRSDRYWGSIYLSIKISLIPPVLRCLCPCHANSVPSRFTLVEETYVSWRLQSLIADSQLKWECLTKESNPRIIWCRIMM